jgi:uncharacterized protein (TIGR02246 family)
MFRVIRPACVFIVCLAAATAGWAQSADPAMEKLRADYEKAWQKGDAKAIAALYSDTAIVVSQDGALAHGRAAIEKAFASNFAGPFKGTTLAITVGIYQPLGSSVTSNEGTYAMKGVVGPDGKPMTLNGRFVNTFVKSGTGWLIAAEAAFMPQGAPAPK